MRLNPNDRFAKHPPPNRAATCHFDSSRLRLLSLPLIHQRQSVAVFRLVVISSLLCIISAQEADVWETVIAQAMEQFCFSPCENGYTGHEGECAISST